MNTADELYVFLALVAKLRELQRVKNPTTPEYRERLALEARTDEELARLQRAAKGGG